MTLLNQAAQEKMYDTRLIEKSIQSGRLQKNDIEKLVNALPDDEENMDTVTWEDVQEQIR